MSEEVVTVQLRQHQDYQYDIDFGAGLPALRADEPPPLGQGTGPSPVQLLAASVGNCLAASLLFALRKFKQDPKSVDAAVRATVGRNEQGRLRVLKLEATLTLGVAGSTLEHLDRVLSGFEAYCTVTQSVAAAVPVAVSVRDAQGALLK